MHATHLTADDIELLGAGGSTVCICPTTERDLADGIGPASRPPATPGARLCLGSDSQAVIDLLEEARAVELDERLDTGRRGIHAAAELLAAATGGGADALGWDGGGRLVAGAPADFCTLRLDGPALAGTLGPGGAGAAAAAVFAARAGEVTDVVVAGRPVVERRGASPPRPGRSPSATRHSAGLGRCTVIEDGWVLTGIAELTTADDDLAVDGPAALRVRPGRDRGMGRARAGPAGAGGWGPHATPAGGP